MSNQRITVIAVDPGRAKCGIAVVSRPVPGADLPAEVLHAEVVSAPNLAPTVAELAARFSPTAVVLGGGTSSRDAAGAIEAAQKAPVVIVDERFSTLEARARYFREHPPRGWRRLIPLSLQTPPEPYDHYVAVILAERYLDPAGAEHTIHRAT